MKLPLPRWSLLCGVGLCALLLLTASAAPPAWWTQRGIVNTNATVNDFAPANQGQLKWIATNAYLELEANLPGGAGSNVTALVQSLSLSNNYRPVNLGQLKFVATPFYDRLIEVGCAAHYPWFGATNPPNDFALVNLGQVKNVFSFDVALDADGDGMPDWWECIYGFDPEINDAGDDADGDRLTNLQEYQRGLNPLVPDPHIVLLEPSDAVLLP